jgi:hypothetical protein
MGAASMTTATGEMSPPPFYAVRLAIEREPKQSRLLNLPFLVGTVIRLILLVPNLVVFYYLYNAAFLAAFVSMWGILFTGRYPRGLFKLEVGIMRWAFNLGGYLSHLFDDYPPMDLEQRPDRPLRLDVDYPEHPSRWLNLPFFPVKFLLVIPHIIVLYVVGIIALLLVFIAQIVILFTGSFPAGLHGFVVGYQRWYCRVIGYLAAFTDKYPPFSLS